jgi:hypothetical protein
MSKRVTYGPLTLPSGKTITFREPLGLDRVNVQAVTKIDEDNIIGSTMTIEANLRAKCVVSVDGKTTDGNYLNLFDDWTDGDMQFYMTVFNELFSMTDEKREEAKAAAKNLRQTLTSTAGSN